MQVYKLLLFVFIITGGLTSCITSRRVNYMQSPRSGIPSYIRKVTDFMCVSIHRMKRQI